MEPILTVEELYYAIAQDCAKNAYPACGLFQIKEWYRLGTAEIELFVLGNLYEERFDEELNDYVFVKRNATIKEYYVKAYDIKNGYKYSIDLDLAHLASILTNKSYVGKETRVRC